jgi:hypothetical protein
LGRQFSKAFALILAAGEVAGKDFDPSGIIADELLAA